MGLCSRCASCQPEKPGELVQGLADDVAELVDLAALDDQRRRQGDGVSDDLDQSAFFEAIHKSFVCARRWIVGAQFEFDSCDKLEIAKCIENLDTLFYEFAMYPPFTEGDKHTKTPPAPSLPKTFSAQYMCSSPRCH
jgi:hypothetical protein